MPPMPRMAPMVAIGTFGPWVKASRPEARGVRL